MVRRIASQVHQQATRLLRSNYLKQEPAWYQAVLEHPPLPLPPRKSTPRTDHDLPPSNRARIQPYEPRPLPIFYIEDDVRRQFFRDHPFEAFRPVSLVESGTVEEHPVHGPAWIRLSQSGRNPSSDDAIRFIVNLHEHHKVPLSQAYARGVAQFRALRAEHRVATSVAALEAEAYGVLFNPGEIERGFRVELHGLQTFNRQAELDEGAIAARKRWKAILDKPNSPDEWSKGQEYVRLWKQGVRPTYMPSLTQSGGHQPRAQSKQSPQQPRTIDFTK